MKVYRYFDWAIFILCTIGYLVEFCFPTWTCEIEVTLGLLGLIYCVYYLRIAIFCPIKLDWILAKGHFMIKVVNFVLFVPFVIVAAFHLINRLSDENIYPEHLVFDDNLYIGKTSPTSFSASPKDPSLFWTVYIHFIDQGNQHMAPSENGRKRAALIAILGFLLLNGLLISTLINWFDRRREQWINGEIRYGWLATVSKKVAIVIGANAATPTIIKKLLGDCGEKPIDYVILLTNEDVEKVREHVSSYLNYDEDNRAIIYNGQLDSIEEVEGLHLERATEIYVLGESSNDDVSQSYHDAQNMRCVHNIASYLTDKHIERKIICRVLFEYQTTYSVFQFSDLPNNIRQHLIFIPFNTYENWAQRVLVQGEYTETIKRITPSVANSSYSKRLANNEDHRTIEYIPLDGKGISPTSKDHVHLIVVGMSKMGVAMAIQAAQIAHYPNFSSGKKDEYGEILRESSPIRTRITFIDENIENEMNFFMGRFQNLFALSRYRYIDASGKDYAADTNWEDAMDFDKCKYKMQGENFIDIEWEFVKGNTQSPGVMMYLTDTALQADSLLESKSILTIAICHPMTHEAIAAALYMPGEIYDNAQQILVYQREASDIIYNLSSKEDIYQYKRYAKLRPFGMQYADFTMDKENYYRSQLCNYVYELMFNDAIDNKRIPDIICGLDISQRDEAHMKLARELWKTLPIFNKWSNRYLSNSFETKLRSIGADSTDIDTHYETICSLFEKYKMEMAECEHNRWNVQQLLMGFRAYKDNELLEFNRLKKNSSSSDEANAAFKDFKKKMKNSPEKVHLNICSNSLLQKLDKEAEGYDAVFNAAIPAILKCIDNHYNRIDT